MMPTHAEANEGTAYTWTEIWFIVGGVVALTAIAGTLVLLMWSQAPNAGNESFRFIVLLILVMAALATTAAVFVSLRMGNPLEAFGLPAGSVRVLLAVGIMILFVVFGLPLVAPPSNAPERIADRPLQTIEVTRGDVPAAIVQHSRQGLTAVVTSYGRVSASPADAGAPARIDLYAKVRTRPADESTSTSRC